jgi:hypothetical protein
MVAPPSPAADHAMVPKEARMGRTLVFIAGLAAGAAASALAGERAAPFGVSVEVVRAGVISLSHGADGPVLQVGAHRVLLEGDGSAVATVEY